MNENTIITYENRIGKLIFAYNSPLWIMDYDGMSAVDVALAETESAYQIGSTITNQSVQPRTLSLDGAIFDPLPINRANVIRVFAPRELSRLTVIRQNESWYIDVIPERTPEITPGNGVQYFQARLKAPYPYWRSAEAGANQGISLIGIEPMFSFLFNTGGTWWLSKFTSNYFSEVNNSGNVPIDFRITILAAAEVVNPEIYHVESQTRILLRTTLSTSQKAVISTVYGDKGVDIIDVDGSVSNGFRLLSIDSNLSMQLQPGTNLFRVDAQEGRENMRVRLDLVGGAVSGV